MMPSFSKRHIYTCIRDAIIIYLFIYSINNFFINTYNEQFRYLIIVLISVCLIYCILRCIWALIATILILATINYYFYNHKTKLKHFIVDFSALFNFFIYLFLISLNIQTLETFNKVDYFLMMYKMITF